MGEPLGVEHAGGIRGAAIHAGGRGDSGPSVSIETAKERWWVMGAGDSLHNHQQSYHSPSSDELLEQLQAIQKEIAAELVRVQGRERRQKEEDDQRLREKISAEVERRLDAERAEKSGDGFERDVARQLADKRIYARSDEERARAESPAD